MRPNLNSELLVRGKHEMQSAARKSVMLMMPALALLTVGIVRCTAEQQGEREKTEGERAARVAETSGDDHGKN